MCASAIYQVQMISRRTVRIEDAEIADGRAVLAAAADAAASRTCCAKRPVETPWRSVAAREYARRNDTLITAAVLRHRTVTSSAGTRSPSATSDAAVRRPARRRRAFPAAAPDGEPLPVVVGRSALKDTSHDRRRRRLVVRSPGAWWR